MVGRYGVPRKDREAYTQGGVPLPLPTWAYIPGCTSLPPYIPQGVLCSPQGIPRVYYAHLSVYLGCTSLPYIPQGVHPSRTYLRVYYAHRCISQGVLCPPVYIPGCTSVSPYIPQGVHPSPRTYLRVWHTSVGVIPPGVVYLRGCYTSGFGRVRPVLALGLGE